MRNSEFGMKNLKFGIRNSKALKSVENTRRLYIVALRMGVWMFPGVSAVLIPMHFMKKRIDEAESIIAGDFNCRNKIDFQMYI